MELFAKTQCTVQKYFPTRFSSRNDGKFGKSAKVKKYIYTWCVQVLRSPKEAFAAAMQSWRERCEKCVCLQGDYVEK